MIINTRRKRKKLNKSDKNCQNCTMFYKGICKVVSEKKGETHYISDKRSAKKCVHFVNKNNIKKS